MRNLNPPNIQEAGSLKRIGSTPDGEVLKRYLLANLTSTDEDNRTADGVNLYRSQGKALTIKAILEALEATAVKMV